MEYQKRKESQWKSLDQKFKYLYGWMISLIDNFKCLKGNSCSGFLEVDFLDIIFLYKDYIMIYFIDAIRLVQQVTYFHFVRNNDMHVCYTLCTEYVAHQYSKQSNKGRRNYSYGQW